MTLLQKKFITTALFRFHFLLLVILMHCETVYYFLFLVLSSEEGVLLRVWEILIFL